MERIASLSNGKIKLAAKLHGRKYREAEGLFLAEGIRLVEMAAASGWGLRFAFCTPAAAAGERVKKILQQLAAVCPVYEVSEEIYRKACGTVTPQGLLVVMEMQRLSLASLREKDGPLFLVLDGVQDPGNAGAMIRTADAAGCSGVICLTDTVDVFADKTVRATMGSLFHLPVVTGVPVAELLEFVQSAGVSLFVTALNAGARQHFAADFTGAAAVVFGNEGNGVSPALLSAGGQQIYIPMQGQAESLNVSTAAAVVLYEAVRQRQAVSQKR